MKNIHKKNIFVPASSMQNGTVPLDILFLWIEAVWIGKQQQIRLESMAVYKFPC